MARAGRWLAVATSITLAAAGAATPSGASTSANGTVEDRQLDRALRRGLEEAGTPGIAASVVFADGRQWTGFAGQADTADRRRVTATTPFAVASVTKTFVAALALQLAEEGTVDLDEPIARWLPDVPGNDVITLRQLLSHTSGLSNGPIGAPSQRWTPDEVLASMGPPDCAPGTCFRYADMNYVAAGAVLEAATTSSLPRLVRRRFLAPLGMTHTWFQSFERARGTVATAYRVGVPLSDGSSNVPTTDFVTRTGYSGALATTARDLAIWGDALLGGKVLRRASLAQMLDFDATADLPCPLPDQCLGGYGLGMAFDQLHASPVWQHSGSTGALLTHLPRQGITIAVLTNSAPGEPPGPFPAQAALADALPSLQRHPGIHAVDVDGADRHLVTSTGAGVGASAAAVSPDGAHLAFVRERGDDGGGDIAIAGIDGQGARLITHDRASNFRPAWSPDGEHLAFASERAGNPEIYVMDTDGGNVVRLTDDPAWDGAPAWSPDGTLIAFDRHVDDRLDIRVVRADGSDERSVVTMTIHGRFTGAPTWSPDSAQLAFAGDVGGVPNIQVVDVDGSDLAAVTTGHVPTTEAAWAPDGTLAFGRLGSLYIGRPDGTNVQKVDRSANPLDYLPAWTPDSGTVFFTAHGR